MSAIDTLRETYGFYRSVIRSGEPFTSTVANQGERAEAALAGVEALLEAAKRVAEHTQQPIDLNYVAVLKDEFEILAAAVRRVEET